MMMIKSYLSEISLYKAAIQIRTTPLPSPLAMIKLLLTKRHFYSRGERDYMCSEYGLALDQEHTGWRQTREMDASKYLWAFSLHSQPPPRYLKLHYFLCSSPLFWHCNIVAYPQLTGLYET